jgi:hypothetical protein
MASGQRHEVVCGSKVSQRGLFAGFVVLVEGFFEEEECAFEVVFAEHVCEAHLVFT